MEAGLPSHLAFEVAKAAKGYRNVLKVKKSQEMAALAPSSCEGKEAIDDILAVASMPLFSSMPSKSKDNTHSTPVHRHKDKEQERYKLQRKQLQFVPDNPSDDIWTILRKWCTMHDLRQPQRFIDALFSIGVESRADVALVEGGDLIAAGFATDEAEQLINQLVNTPYFVGALVPLDSTTEDNGTNVHNSSHHEGNSHRKRTGDTSSENMVWGVDHIAL